MVASTQDVGQIPFKISMSYVLQPKACLDAVTNQLSCSQEGRDHIFALLTGVYGKIMVASTLTREDIYMNRETYARRRERLVQVFVQVIASWCFTSESDLTWCENVLDPEDFIASVSGLSFQANLKALCYLDSQPQETFTQAACLAGVIEMACDNPNSKPRYALWQQMAVWLTGSREPMD